MVAETVMLVKGVADSLRKASALRHMRDYQKAAPVKGDVSIDSGLLGRAPAHTQDLGVVTRVVTGVVVDSLAYAHLYKVQVDHGGPAMACTFLGSSSNTFMGAKSLTTLLPSTRVWVLLHPQMPYGVIIATEPDVIIDGRDSLADFITTVSRSGFKVDDAHAFPSVMANGSGVTDFSSWRPFDGTSAGEWGHITETGLRLFLDPFMAQLAVNEACGVFAFFFDNMLRLAGHNLQMRTSGSELEALNDQGEFINYQGYTPYTWENKGVTAHGVVPGTERDAQASQIDEQHYAEREPVYDDQKPFHRIQNYHGYLGQGGQRRIYLPPSADYYRYSNTSDSPAVFSEDMSLTGRYSLRSAKAITIAKRVPMVNPERARRPEAVAEGEWEGNYKFAGVFHDDNSVPPGITVPDHEVRDELDFPDGATADYKWLVRAAGVLDAHVHTFNWEANHAYWYHRGDWHVQQEEDGSIASMYQVPIPFGSLATSQYLEPPEARTHKVDHRYAETGDARYYPNESSIDLLEDGGIVIADGFGSELRMTGGHVFISAPGDIWLKSGRNTNVWAGQDSITRAKNSVDITANDRDVRIKAENNMQLLAGNSGIGGLLLESRGTMLYDYAPNIGEDVSSGGVVVKSSKAPAVTLGEGVYIRSGLDVSSSMGEITLDCNQGRGVYKTNAQYQEHFVRHGIWWWFCDGEGDNVGNITSSYEFVPGWCSIGGSCGINGHLAINGHKANRGWDLVVDGHYASTWCDPRVYCLEGESLAQTLAFIEEATTQRQSLLASIGIEQYESQFVDWWYPGFMPGNNSKIASIGVSMRTQEQYLTSDFTLFEDRWQQLARLSEEASGTGSAQTGKWEENPVPITAKKDEPIATYPYPGKEAWKDDHNLYELGLRYSDHEEESGFVAKAVERNDEGVGAPYTGSNTEPPFSYDQISAQGIKALDGNYRVIIGSASSSVEDSRAVAGTDKSAPEGPDAPPPETEPAPPEE
tara:strand:- start:1712 stop:4657 length:2946 start_codon:yes stop_codon:yes gene_type:complete